MNLIGIETKDFAKEYWSEISLISLLTLIAPDIRIISNNVIKIIQIDQKTIIISRQI